MSNRDSLRVSLLISKTYCYKPNPNPNAKFGLPCLGQKHWFSDRGLMNMTGTEIKNSRQDLVTSE